MLPVATALPEPFAAWERIALDLPALNRSARLRAAVDRAEPVDPLAVAALGPSEQRRAYVLFAAIAHSYVNGGSVPWAKLDSASAAASPAVASSAPMPELPAQLFVVLVSAHAVPSREVLRRRRYLKALQQSVHFGLRVTQQRRALIAVFLH